MAAADQLPATAARVLVVDDDKGMRQLVRALLGRAGFAVAEAPSAAEALDQVRREHFDLVLSDILMPGESGLELLAELRRVQHQVPVVLMTGFGNAEMAEHALGGGAFDYLEKPLDRGELVGVVQRALERAERSVPDRAPAAARTRAPSGDFVGEGAAMGRLFATVRKAAVSPSSVLITGESGTGKELVARTLHELSPRKRRVLVPVNCTAIPEGLLESELFGHVRGAFTGATQDRPGLFVQADGGSLFLDEIGDMGPELQAKLLRVLQDHEIRPVGSSRTQRVDVRIIAATHKDLETEIAAGRFRQDLYYRLNVIRIRIPPLRERPEDIPGLVRVFVRRHDSGRPRRFTREAIRRLQAHPWPGNARELENAVERALVLTDGEVIDVPDLLTEGIVGEGQPARAPGLTEAARRGVKLQDLTEQYIDAVLELTGGRQGEAARRLGVDRKTLYRRRLSRSSDRDDPEADA